jgi:hypothetical protein
VIRKQRMAAVLLALALVSSGCHKKVAHPNAINNFDGSAYDALTAAQGALDEAKAQFAAGRLPQSAKPIINSTGESYNAARGAWLSYRDVAMGLKSGDLGELQSDLATALTSLNAAVGQLKAATGGGK